MEKTKTIIEYCKKAMEKLDKDDDEYPVHDFMTVMQSQATTAEEYYLRACVKQLSRDQKGAFQDFTTAIELDPNHTDAYYGREWSKLTIDGNFTRTGKLIIGGAIENLLASHAKETIRTAVKDYNKAVELNPEINKKKF